MITMTTKEQPNGYYITEAFITGKEKPITNCGSLNREYTIKEVEKYCAIVKKNLQK